MPLHTGGVAQRRFSADDFEYVFHGGLQVGGAM
jgi:hypothetical protein